MRGARPRPRRRAGGRRKSRRRWSGSTSSNPRQVGGHRAKAAALLGIDPKTLYRKILSYADPSPDQPSLMRDVRTGCLPGPGGSALSPVSHLPRHVHLRSSSPESLIFGTSGPGISIGSVEAKSEIKARGSTMMRVLLIDGNRAFAESVAMSCITDGIAVRLAENAVRGRSVHDGRAGLVVLIDSALMRLSGPGASAPCSSTRVAPGVPVAVTVLRRGRGPRSSAEVFQVAGLPVAAKPFEVRSYPLEPRWMRPARPSRARPGAIAQVEAPVLAL